MLDVMPELATTARPVGIMAKTELRLAVALTMAVAVWLLLLTHRRISPSSMLFRLIILALSATMAFALFEVWPRRLPRRLLSPRPSQRRPSDG